MEKLYGAFASLFSVNMGVRAGERIIAFSDVIRSEEKVAPADRERRQRLLETARAAADYARQHFSNVSFVEFPATAASGVEPPLLLWQAVFGGEIIRQLLPVNRHRGKEHVRIKVRQTGKSGPGSIRQPPEAGVAG